MIRVEENVLFINDNRVELPCSIRKYIEYNGGAVVLFYDDAIPDDNVEFYDENGNKLWSINDLLNIKIPPAYVSIGLKDNILCAISYTGIAFKIDMKDNKLVDKVIIK